MRNLLGRVIKVKKNSIVHCPLSLTPVINIVRVYLPEFMKKFKMAPMEYSGVRGTLIREINLKSKISCQTPFKGAQV
jgi:hypothetical protein